VRHRRVTPGGDRSTPARPDGKRTRRPCPKPGPPPRTMAHASGVHSTPSHGDVEVVC
jgi:hypothetical protein